MVIALLPAVNEGRLHTYYLYELQTKMVRRSGWNATSKCSLGVGPRSELQWWETYLTTRKERPLDAAYKSHDLTICASDASDNAIAGVLISDATLPYWCRYLSRRERRAKIALKELQAVWESLLVFETTLTNTHVNFRSDSKVIVSALNKWGSRDPTLLSLLKRISLWCLERNIRLSATFIGTHSNTFADYLTRDVTPSVEESIEARVLARGIRHERKGVEWRLKRLTRNFLYRNFNIFSNTPV